MRYEEIVERQRVLEREMMDAQAEVALRADPTGRLAFRAQDAIHRWKDACKARADAELARIALKLTSHKES